MDLSADRLRYVVQIRLVATGDDDVRQTGTMGCKQLLLDASDGDDLGEDWPTGEQTGEVTLQGKVLPIGGVKQKLLAAHRAGLTDVIVPRRNEPDLDDVPESVRAEIHIHPVSTVAEVLSLALSLDVASGERLLQAA